MKFLFLILSVLLCSSYSFAQDCGSSSPGGATSKCIPPDNRPNAPGVASKNTKPLYIKMSLSTGYVDGVGTIVLTPLDDGRISVLHDRNTCSQAGCTERGYQPQVVTAEDLSDQTVEDAPTVLGLTKSIQLEIVREVGTYKYNVLYTCKVGPGLGPQKELRLPLRTQIGLRVQQ